MNNQRMTAAQIRGFPTELALQTALVRSWRLHHPGVVINGCPASVKTRGSQRRKLTEAGYRRGWPDLFIAVARQGLHGLFIEVKRKGGRMNPGQEDTLTALSSAGYCAVLAEGWEAAEAVRQWYMGGEGEFPKMTGLRRF